MKRYKYQTLVTLAPPHEGGALPALPGPTCRMVVRAHHRQTHTPKMFSALVTSDEGSPVARDAAVSATLIVLGDDACDYLAPGEHFALWRGHDLGSGVVTRRIFV